MLLSLVVSQIHVMGIKAKAGFQSFLPRLVRITQLIVIRGVVRAAGGISFLLSNPD
jgi:hypothetical protein